MRTTEITKAIKVASFGNGRAEITEGAVEALNTLACVPSYRTEAGTVLIPMSVYAAVGDALEDGTGIRRELGITMCDRCGVIHTVGGEHGCWMKPDDEVIAELLSDVGCAVADEGAS